MIRIREGTRAHALVEAFEMDFFAWVLLRWRWYSFVGGTFTAPGGRILLCLLPQLLQTRQFVPSAASPIMDRHRARTSVPAFRPVVHGRPPRSIRI